MESKFDEIIQQYIEEEPQAPQTPPNPDELSDTDKTETPPGEVGDPSDLPPEQEAPKPKEDLPDGLATSIVSTMIRTIKWVRNNMGSAELEALLADDVPINDQEAINFLEKIDSLTSRDIKPAYPTEFHGPAVKNQ